LKVLTAKIKEKLANEILALLKEHSLDGDVSIYFNEKRLKGNGAIEENKRGSDIFKHATDNTISMAFEGDLYDVMNYRYESLAEKFIPLFTKLLNSYGLFYEKGDEWNLGTYYHDAPAEVNNLKDGDSPEQPIYITRSNCPPSIEPIRFDWEQRQNEYGDVGSAVVGAGFTFKFDSAFYRMTPQGKWQGSVSWEASADIIKQMLIGAGCENVIFHYGIMD
jgi:hypothetical protein